ncbi:MAG: hypothetical protein KatS3mg038_1537 [Candidatus Kapaibacterium sp.]|jgi:hypothetical protein|nr:MAG: hypothetical protein KatS3mg038_1537 [Candidatus Kapabacteria bacterium]
MNIIQHLRSPNAALIVLIAALVAQLPHAADVFRMLIGGEGWLYTLHSYSYAIALELAVLLFVVQHRNTESVVFAIVSVLVNLAYYSMHNVALFRHDVAPQWLNDVVRALPAWLISIALPAAIARYSHLIADAAKNSKTEQKSETENKESTPLIETQAQAQPQHAQPAARKVRRSRTMTAAQRRAHVAELGYTDAKTIAQQFGVSLRTAQNDLAALRNGDKR